MMIHPHSSHTNNNHHHHHHHHLPFHRNNKHHHCQEDLFQSYTIFSSCDEDDSSIVDDIKPLPSLTMSHRLMITQDLKMSDIRSQLISHKLLLTNLIKVKESEVKILVKKTKQRIKQDDLLEEPGQTYLDKILETSRNSRISSKFPHNAMSIRKGICCYEDDVSKCEKPSLPFSRHCKQHILFNVDQLLFVRCTAKDSETLAQCCNPSLDVLRDDPVCNHHRHVNSFLQPSLKETDELKASNPIGGGEKSGKGKPQAGPGRPGKRTKKRRKLTGGKVIPGSIDSVDSSSLFSQDSSDSPATNSENCDTSQIYLSASIKIEPNNETVTVTAVSTASSIPSTSMINGSLASEGNQRACIVPTIPQTISIQMQQQLRHAHHHHHHHHQHQHQHQHQQHHQHHHQHQPTSQSQQKCNNTVSSSQLTNERTTLDNLTVIPSGTILLRTGQTNISNQSLTSSVPVVLADTTKNGIIPGHLDTSLAPSDEALVASLVAELPPLCTENGPEPEPAGFVDADLTDVLNKIPDDAFNDLFVDNLKNGDIPSKEESEALEQALAAVSKNVQYLSVAAAAVGNGSRSTVNNGTREGVTSASSTNVINGNANYYSHPTHHHNYNHAVVNGEIPQLSHQTTSSVTTPSSQLVPQLTPSQSVQRVSPSVPSLPSLVSPAQPLASTTTHSSHDLTGRSIAPAPSLNLNENDIIGLANNILTSLTTEQQQQLNGLIDGALASGTLTSSPTIKSALASFSNIPQESETHL